MRRSNLSLSTLRGLYVDISQGSAKSGVYFYGKCKIIVENDDEEFELPTTSTPEMIEKKSSSLKYKAELKRLLYHQRRRLGLCTKCGSKAQITRKGTSGILCEKCNIRRQRYDRTKAKKPFEVYERHYKKKKTTGLCIRCGIGRRTIGKQGTTVLLCADCLKKKIKYDKARYYGKT